MEPKQPAFHFVKPQGDRETKTHNQTNAFISKIYISKFYSQVAHFVTNIYCAPRLATQFAEPREKTKMQDP